MEGDPLKWHLPVRITHRRITVPNRPFSVEQPLVRTRASTNPQTTQSQFPNAFMAKQSSRRMKLPTALGLDNMGSNYRSFETTRNPMFYESSQRSDSTTVRVPRRKTRSRIQPSLKLPVASRIRSNLGSAIPTVRAN